MSNPCRKINHVSECAAWYIARMLARERRWSAPACSTVFHDVYGWVVVPHISNMTALENAAEIWGVSPYSISKHAKVMQWKPEDGPCIRISDYGGKYVLPNPGAAARPAGAGGGGYGNI